MVIQGGVWSPPNSTFLFNTEMFQDDGVNLFWFCSERLNEVHIKRDAGFYIYKKTSTNCWCPIPTSFSLVTNPYKLAKGFMWSLAKIKLQDWKYFLFMQPKK